MKVNFIEFDGIKEYARVMYNDVKEADKKRIEVMYNGQDIKDLLEYLFDLEQKIDEAIEYIKEEELDLEEYNDNFINTPVVDTQKLLEILKGSDK